MSYGFSPGILKKVRVARDRLPAPCSLASMNPSCVPFEGDPGSTDESIQSVTKCLRNKVFTFLFYFSEYTCLVLPCDA
jgi:hypothetical protein